MVLAGRLVIRLWAATFVSAFLATVVACFLRLSFLFLFLATAATVTVSTIGVVCEEEVTLQEVSGVVGLALVVSTRSCLSQGTFPAKSGSLVLFGFLLR